MVDRSELEQALSRLRELEEADRRKDEFLALLAHELRSPLAAVLTWVHVMREPNADKGVHDRAIAGIERSARLQARMIDDLFESSRIAAGKLSLELQDVEIPLLVANTVDAALMTAKEKLVEVSSFVDPQVPLLRGDPARLQQAIGNVLANAVKFCGRGGKVGVAVRRIDGETEIAIEDDGEGIPPEVLPYIFDRFRQGDASIARRHDGLGLGLSIARYVIERHGGRIEAASAGAGKGATFRIRLPDHPLGRPSA